MPIVRWPDSTAFLARAQHFLLADEARHTLPLGSAIALAAISANAPRPASAPFFSTIEIDEEIVATATIQPPYSLVISPSARVAETGYWPWLIDLAETVRASHPDVRGVQTTLAMARAFGEAWTRRCASGQVAVSLRVHTLTTVLPLPDAPGTLRRGSREDRRLVLSWLDAMHAEALPDDPPIDAERVIRVRLSEEGDPWLSLYLWELLDGSLVSICGASGPTPGAVRVNAVYTPPEHRRRGHATAAVAELSRRIVASGRRSVLFTDLGNPTSNRIYAQIGYEPVCDVVEWRFDNLSHP